MPVINRTQGMGSANAKKLRHVPSAGPGAPSDQSASAPKVTSISPHARRPTQMPGMFKPSGVGATGGGVVTQQPTTIAEDFNNLIAGLQSEVADMAALSADMSPSMSTMQGIIDYANNAYRSANSGTPNFTWSGYGTGTADRPGRWLSKIQAFALQRLPADLQRAQKAQADMAALQQQLDAANAALANGGPMNTYAASLQARLSTTGGGDPSAGATNDKTVSTKGAVALGAGGLTLGGLAGFFIAKVTGR